MNQKSGIEYPVKVQSLKMLVMEVLLGLYFGLAKAGRYFELYGS
jgi:hypothetical protein